MQKIHAMHYVEHFMVRLHCIRVIPQQFPPESGGNSQFDLERHC